MTTSDGLGEFQLIDAMRERWGALAQGIGDDAAVLMPPRGDKLVVSVDASVDRVHFVRSWLTLREIGYRAVTAALSDLAAMAATPRGVLVAITVPAADRASLFEIADGIGDAAKAAGTVIVGGNLSAGETLSITTTVVGSAYAPLSRGAARPGHLLYVTGRFGGPALALEAFKAGRTPPDDIRARFARPVARIAEARWLAARGVVAAIDISDGLLQDAAHLATASTVGLQARFDAIPTYPGISGDAAAASGEEYELLVASPVPLPVEEFSARFGIPLTEVGRAGEPSDGTGARVEQERGHDHFSR